MTNTQKIIKYAAIAFAIILIAAIISGIVSTAASVMRAVTGFESDTDGGTSTSYSFDISEVKNIDMELSASSLTVKRGDTLSVEVSSDRISVRQSGDTLKIQEKDTFFSKSLSSRSVTLILPDHTFEKVNIEAGAGNISIDGLTADVLELDLGAGNTYIYSLTVGHSADIDGGAGDISISQSSINGLELDIGIGNVDISSALTGKSDIDCGVGKLDLTLFGAKSDYSVKADKGLGSFTVDGSSVRDSETVGNGANEVRISSGVGAVTVKFE